jgi:hypothetical protein
MSDGKQLSWADIDKQTGGSSSDGVASLGTVMGQKIEITKVETAQGNNGELVIFTTKDGRRIRSGAKAIREKAAKMLPLLSAGNTITVTPVSKTSRSGRTYHDFE